MSDFSFDDRLSPNDNIQAFLAHLDTIDVEMANLLRTHVGKLLPLPTGPERTTRRVEFNNCIVRALDAKPTTSEPTAT